jgi:hypothetical protein
MARMIPPELIAAHSKYLAAQKDDRHFIPECRRLMDAIKDGVISDRNRQRGTRRPLGPLE